ncbi:hypothetical protein MKW98_005785 [Papaver atlanticum]|uniref:Uncharacterized protein n=1 Tax=Papaver atlanticum TaxID=357466 RepID=A0AAD4TLF4_9MAGN|nr:hypothetical protein MKW98_005785 [Papaver atlanticum]
MRCFFLVECHLSSTCGSWNYNINGVKHNTNLTCGIKLGSMVTLRISARLVGYLLSRKGLNLLRHGSPLWLMNYL